MLSNPLYSHIKYLVCFEITVLCSRPLASQVHEIPREEFKGQEVVVGPILRISCSEVVRFLKPVTIQLPVSLGDEQLDIPDVSKCHVRVLFLRSEEDRKEWVEITEDVKNSTKFDGKTVTFKVQRFSGYECSSISV